MGPSGSGKSTLMHCLAGLDRPTSGSVTVDGVDLGTLDDGKLTELRRDKVGFVFQFFNLLPVLSAEENILLPLNLAGRKRRHASASTSSSTRSGSATGSRTGRPSSRAASSSASRSRARWSPRPRSCSPTSRPETSTPTRSEEVLALMRRAADEFGQTIVMVTHDAGGRGIADRVLVLVDGRIVQDAAPKSPEAVLDLMKQVA